MIRKYGKGKVKEVGKIKKGSSGEVVLSKVKKYCKICGKELTDNIENEKEVCVLCSSNE